MKLSTDWHDFLAKLDKFFVQGKPSQLSFDYQGERSDDDGGDCDEAAN
jgi:hypothetical protein